ncbi:MAG: PilZ domain-containing protein [Anaerolineales bacterium]|nr:PilZ domain-containing protein [Anaerolineales bacterium]
MDNKRKVSRKKLIAFTPVYDLLHKTLLGYIGDLTPQGVMVIGQKQWEINKHFTLGIEFPSDEAQDHTLKIVTSARVAWCKPDETPQYFNIGFEFLDVSPEKLKIIDAVLTRYQFRHAMSISDLNP